MSEPVKNPLKLFYCYAHEDKMLCDALDDHLINLKRQKLIEIWYDGEISAGAEWEKEIDKHLNSADIILLLVSAAFLKSDYCYGKEMEKALKMHKEGKARVVPIIMRPVDWEDTPFSKLQVLPTSAQPVTTWANTDVAYANIAKNLRVIVNELQISQEIAAYYHKGFALNESKRYEEAILALDQAIQLDPNYANAYRSKGFALYNLKRYKQALEAYKQAVRLDTNNINAYNGQGLVLCNLKRYEEALATFEHALHIDPNNINTYHHKGNTLHSLGKYTEALETFEQALRVDPDNAYAYHHKGNALYGLTRYAEALEAYEQALLINPYYAIVYHNKGLALDCIGRSTEAHQARERARELGFA